MPHRSVSQELGLCPLLVSPVCLHSTMVVAVAQEATMRLNGGDGFLGGSILVGEYSYGGPAHDL